MRLGRGVREEGRRNQARQWEGASKGPVAGGSREDPGTIVRAQRKQEPRDCRSHRIRFKQTRCSGVSSSAPSPP